MIKRLFATALIVMAVSAPANRATAVPLISGDYYEETAGMGVCTVSNTCVPNFSDFPASTAGKFITLTEMSCDMFAFGAVTPITERLIRVFIDVSDAGLNPRRRHAVTASGLSGPQSFSAPLNLKMAGGPPRRPVLTLVASTPSGFGGTCTLVGKITPN